MSIGNVSSSGGIENLIMVSPTHVPFEGTLADKKTMTGHSVATWQGKDIPFVKADFSVVKAGKYQKHPAALHKVTGMWVAYYNAYKDKEAERKTSHRKWLETPGKKGQKHNDTNIRVFVDDEDVFYDKWHLLEMKAVDDKELPKDTYDALISFIPRLKGIEYGKVQPEHQTGDGSIERPYQMPYYIYSDVVQEFENEVYKFEREHPDFWLNRYNDVMLLNGLKWDEEVMTNADVNCLNGQAVMSLLLGAIRAERFCDGALNAFLEAGCIDKWLLRLQEIRDM